MKNAKTEPRARLDDLRRFASDLAAASGLRPDRASALAGILLWQDASGLPDHGLATLPDLLDRITRGQIDPKSEPKVGPERASTAVVDGRSGPPPLVLARAAELAAEKARDYGVGLVRVHAIGPIASALAAVAEIAIGPFVGAAMGPAGAWSIALPAPEGPPLLADSSMGRGLGPLSGFVPWAPLSADGWIMQAASVAALGTLASFHERVRALAESGSALEPGALEALRREAREGGVTLSKATRAALAERAERMGIEALAS